MIFVSIPPFECCSTTAKTGSVSAPAANLSYRSGKTLRIRNTGTIMKCFIIAIKKREAGWVPVVIPLFQSSKSNMWIDLKTSMCLAQVCWFKNPTHPTTSFPLNWIESTKRERENQHVLALPFQANPILSLPLLCTDRPPQPFVCLKIGWHENIRHVLELFCFCKNGTGTDINEITKFNVSVSASRPPARYLPGSNLGPGSHPTVWSEGRQITL